MRGAPKIIAILLMIAAAVVIMAVSLVGGFGHPWLLLLFLVGCALSGLWTAAVVLIGQRFAGAELSGAYVAGGILYGLGSLAGPLFTGLLSDWAGLAIVPLALAGFCLIYLPFGLLRDRQA